MLELASYKGQRNFVGLWWFSGTNSHVPFESWVERDTVMLLDRDPSAVAVRSQPFQLQLSTGRHVPDYFVRRSDGSALVLDVRPDSLVEDSDQEVFDATREACGLIGWSYSRVGELGPVARANHRWLANFRHSRCADTGLSWGRLNSAIGPSLRIDQVAGVCGIDPVAVLPHVYHRIWTGDLTTDESVLLSGASRVRARERM